MSKIILIGGGGHCKSCIDIIELNNKFKIIGIIDKNKKKHDKVLNYKILGNDKDLIKYTSKVKNALITLGQIKDASNRIKIFNNLIKLDFNFPIIISNNSFVSKYAKIQKGSIVMNKVHICAGTKIGKNCIINNKALIEHDCKIMDHTHISTGAILNGNVKIGRGSFIGSGAIIKNNITIGSKSIIDAGVYINKNVTSNTLIRNEKK